MNPVDWKIREGLLKERMPYAFPLILGWDAAGIITNIGKKVTQFKIGDQVYAYCRKSTIQWGTYAEKIHIDASSIALKPKTLNFAAAASIPLAGLTAWQALFDIMKLKKDEEVLIHARAGGVGSLAIQFAKNTQAIVFSTSSEENIPYVKKQVHDDYKKENFVEKILQLYPDGIDAVFDTVGGSTLTDSAKILKKGGRLVSLLGTLPKEISQNAGIKDHYLFVSPNGKELREITHWIDQGKVFPPRFEEMPLIKAAEAQEKLKKGLGGGKIVLEISPS